MMVKREREGKNMYEKKGEEILFSQSGKVYLYEILIFASAAADACVVLVL
jgi:hypothetical protein